MVQLIGLLLIRRVYLVFSVHTVERACTRSGMSVENLTLTLDEETLNAVSEDIGFEVFLDHMVEWEWFFVQDSPINALSLSIVFHR